MAILQSFARSVTSCIVAFTLAACDPSGHDYKHIPFEKNAYCQYVESSGTTRSYELVDFSPILPFLNGDENLETIAGYCQTLKKNTGTAPAPCRQMAISDHNVKQNKPAVLSAKMYQNNPESWTEGGTITAYYNNFNFCIHDAKKYRLIEARPHDRTIGHVYHSLLQ